MNMLMESRLDSSAEAPEASPVKREMPATSRIRVVVSTREFKLATTDMYLSCSHHLPLSISIFNNDARLVQKTTAGWQPGESMVSWDGTGKNGKPVPAGMYLLRISCGNNHDHRLIQLVSRADPR